MQNVTVNFTFNGRSLTPSPWKFDGESHDMLFVFHWGLNSGMEISQDLMLGVLADQRDSFDWMEKLAY